MVTRVPGSVSSSEAKFPLPGIEADNLLGFLALLGTLRALEETRPDLEAKISWSASPWLAWLHLADEIDRQQLAREISEGCVRIASRFDGDGKQDVSFDRGSYRSYAERVRKDPVNARLAAALAAELPERKDGSLAAAPLVMMFGQGHQHFLERLVSVPVTDPGKAAQDGTAPPDPNRIAEALFERWNRSDRAKSFRWDPEENQRYAYRFDDPSRARAAPTVHGANRLAAIGFLSFACAPGSRTPRVAGVIRENGQVAFVWPLWRQPLSLHGIEAFLANRSVLAGDLDAVRALGIIEILRANRVANGKFMKNVTRAKPHRRPPLRH